MIHCRLIIPWVLSHILISLLLNACSGRGSGSEYDTLNEKQKHSQRASRFTLEENDSFTRLTIINPWQGATGADQVWHLVPSGSFPPENVDPSEIIYVPVKNVVCMSSTHLAMISALGEEESIKGVSGAGFLYNPELIKRYEQGFIKDVGYEDNLNKELILDLSPDLIMAYSIGSESAAYMTKLKELGIKVMYNADYLESDPLGKAEWIKLFGALYCCRERADSLFREISDEYHRLKKYILENTDSKPNVLLGLPFRDTWYISPGNSYISKLISDAGGNYLWNETYSSVSMPMGIENVYIKALNADIWLNPGSASAKDEIIAVDPRLASLPCFTRGSIYNNTKRINGRGANDYWESGTLNPHVLLRDIAAIMHPGLIAKKDLVYYRKIE
jgi:iron complex transport system substrate-binding protein